MKKIVLIALLSAIFLSACGATRNKHEWKKAYATNPLEIPPGLDDSGVNAQAQQALVPQQDETQAHPEMAPVATPEDENQMPAGSGGETQMPGSAAPMPQGGTQPPIQSQPYNQ